MLHIYKLKKLAMIILTKSPTPVAALGFLKIKTRLSTGIQTATAGFYFPYRTLCYRTQ